MKDDLDVEHEVWQAQARTELAWSRGGLSVVACVVVLVRRLTEYVTSGRTQVLALALVVIAATAVGLFVLAWRGNREREVTERAPLIVGGTLALAAVAFVLALFPAG